MATEKMIRRAKVTLVKGKTYTMARIKYIRNVPKTVKGDSAIAEFENNGRFSCIELEPKPAKKKKKKKSSGEGTTKKKSSKKKTKSLKKKTKKKVRK